MGNIQLLDCTLGNAVYKNTWRFDESEISEMICKMTSSNVEILEVGILNNEAHCQARMSRAISKKKNHLKYSALMDIGNAIPIDALAPKGENSVDIITVVFWKGLLNEGYEYCKSIAEKGYDICIYPERTAQYSHKEFVEMLELVSKLKPLAIYIDDNYGMENEACLTEYIKLADSHLGQDIALGFSVNNNLMQSFDMFELFLNLKLERDIIINACIFGLGKGASFLNIELAVMRLNEIEDKSYKIEPMLEVYDEYLEEKYDNKPWGYSLTSFLTATHKCNPVYGYYYGEDLEINTEEINNILKKLTSIDKAVFHLVAANRHLQKYRSKNWSLCVVIPTCNRPKSIDFWMSSVGRLFEIYGIDIIIYDSSDDDDTEEIVKDYNSKGLSNVFYVRYDKEFDGFSIDDKVIEAYKEYAETYDYVWVCRDGVVINIGDIYDDLQEILEENYECIVVDSKFRDLDMVGSKEYTDCRELFKDQCVRMVTLGCTIVSSKFIKNVIREVPLDKEKNYSLWLTIAIFQYYENNKVYAKSYMGNTFSYNPVGTDASFWKAAGKVFWQWAERWYISINLLPEVYDNEKADVMEIKMVDFSPFSFYSVAQMKSQSNLSIKTINKYKEYIKKVTSTPIFLFYFIALVPSVIVKLFVKCPNNIFVRIVRLFYKLIKFIFRTIYITLFPKKIKVKKRKTYSGTNYEDYVDCFAQKADIKSQLIYGDLKYMPKPWLTILIPTYKRVDLLEEAMNSVLNQKPVDFDWDILVVDNEKNDGKPNDTETYIKSLNNPRILYYRNDKNLGPAGNFNRGIELARGEWVSILHSDDLLISGFLQMMERRIRFYNKKSGKPLAYISCRHQFFKSSNIESDTKTKKTLQKAEKKLYAEEDRYRLERVRQNDLIFFGTARVDLPSCGTTMKKDVIMKLGGYNNDLGISSDMILPYRVMKKHAVYKTEHFMGFYRWEKNDSLKEDTNHKIEECLYDFREYAYQKNVFSRIWGDLFREQQFIAEVTYLVNAANYAGLKQGYSDYDDILIYSQNKTKEKIYFHIILKIFEKVKNLTIVLGGDKKFLFYSRRKQIASKFRKEKVSNEVGNRVAAKPQK